MALFSHLKAAEVRDGKSRTRQRMRNRVVTNFLPRFRPLAVGGEVELKLAGLRGKKESREEMSRAQTPPAYSIALILLEMKSGVIMVVIWVYIPPPLRTAFSPFLS